jgi:type IX secretion system PorP/SprF family membrane protein
MKQLILFTALFFQLSSISWGQDFHLSQYDAAPLNVNPALTGIFKGDYRIHGHYRTQWAAVATKPFTTGLVSFDMRHNKEWAFGGQIANFRAGTGGFNVVSVLPSASYRLVLGEKKHHALSFGAQIGFFQKSINASSLTFANQYVKTNGGEFNTALSSGETFANNGIFKLDINAGMMYYFTKPHNRINPFGGFTFYHLNRPTESFLGEFNKLAIRPQIIGGTRIIINPKIAITPKLFYQYQDKASEFTYAVSSQFYLDQYDVFLLGSIIFRDEDAAIFEFGARYGNFIGRLSYDINTSSLNNVSSGRGGTEFSLTYIFSRPNPNPIPTCPKL